MFRRKRAARAGLAPLPGGPYGAAVNPPTVVQALRMSARATRRSLWLAPVGMALGWLGLAAGWPTFLFLGAVAARGAGAAAGPDPFSALEGALLALTSPRTAFIAGGLWLAGHLLRGALRVLWLAGALPTLGEALAGREAPAFAAGAVWGLWRVLPTAVLGFLLEALALGSALGAVVGAVAVSARLAGRGGQGGSALIVALALTSAVAAPLLAGLLADAALCRCALRGEGPARAFARAALRLGRRPSAFAAAALAVAAAALVLGGSIDLVTSAALQLAAAGAPAVLLAVPQLGAAALGALAAALFELWRLGAIAALTCHAAAGD